jgi:hypothetical protein
MYQEPFPFSAYEEEFLKLSISFSKYISTNMYVKYIHATLFLGSSTNLKISKLRDFTT